MVPPPSGSTLLLALPPPVALMVTLLPAVSALPPCVRLAAVSVLSLSERPTVKLLLALGPCAVWIALTTLPPSARVSPGCGECQSRDSDFQLDRPAFCKHSRRPYYMRQLLS